MKIFSSKKRVAAIGALTAATLVGGGMAVAYWTTTGTGSGTATVGTDADNIAVTATVTGALSPGGPAGVVSFTASNPADFNQKLSNIELVGITPDSEHSACSTVLDSDFSMVDVPVGDEGNLEPGADNVTLTAQGELLMLDTGVSQDACQGATLTLSFTTS